MKLLSASAILLSWLLLQAPAVASQTETFDDLARRGQAAINDRPAEAVALLDKALEMRPSWGEGWLYRGGGLYRLGRLAEARDSFRKGTALERDNGPGWAFLGLVEYDLAEHEQALANITKGEALGLGNNPPFEALVRVRGASLLLRLSAFDEACAQIEPLAKLEGEFPQAIEPLGMCVLTRGGLPSQLSPGERALIQAAGKAQWAAIGKRQAEAEAAFRALLTSFPTAPGVHYAYGLFLMGSDQHAALAEFRKELQANPAHWPSLLSSAFLEIRGGSPTAAIELVERARKLVPQRQVWLCHAELGHAALVLEQPDKAIPELEAAAKLQPENSTLHFYLEQAYRRAGRHEEARKERAEFLRLKAQQDPLGVAGRVTGLAP